MVTLKAAVIVPLYLYPLTIESWAPLHEAYVIYQPRCHVVARAEHHQGIVN